MNADNRCTLPYFIVKAKRMKEQADKVEVKEVGRRIGRTRKNMNKQIACIGNC